jgi:hypothetical protein
LASDPDICLVGVPLARDGSLAMVEPFQQLGRVTDNPSVNGRVVNGDAAFGHHLLEITQAEIVGQIPADAEHDH